MDIALLEPKARTFLSLTRFAFSLGTITFLYICARFWTLIHLCASLSNMFFYILYLSFGTLRHFMHIYTLSQTFVRFLCNLVHLLSLNSYQPVEQFPQEKTLVMLKTYCPGDHRGLLSL